MIDDSDLRNIIVGRVEPHIYAFTTNSVPNYLKVGDTYRPVAVRLNEWRRHFPNLKKQYEHTAKISNDVYFRDFSIHQFLEQDKKKIALKLGDFPGIYYSKEFFKDATKKDVKEAISDIEKNYKTNTNKYKFYNPESRLPTKYKFSPTEDYDLRPNQRETVKAFHEARKNGRKNLLMYAVMRFGKSFTSMCCALDMDAKLVVVVSAKPEVELEWKKAVESHVKFVDYVFLDSKDLVGDKRVISKNLKSGKKVVVFLSLQDLQGNKIKEKHKEIFEKRNQIDLLLVDETHFGARAEKYGAVLSANNYQPDIKHKKDDEDFVDIEEADKIIKVLQPDTTIHLSGTPYRILMGSEFKKEDIIAFCQFTDIIKEKEAWDNEHLLDDNYKEWDNPYYGFPQMVRFAFHPSEKARQRLSELKKAGTTYAFSALLKPKSIEKDANGLHKQFVFENEVLDLFEVIDGCKKDKNLLGFLNYDKIKKGEMCRHIVVVLPYCASCDALEALIKNNAKKFRNLQEYNIINISGVDNPNAYKKPDDIKRTIGEFEEKGEKTITLTVNRMLTGSTVPEWDTMIYLKDTASPQEYDQAIFRLQNQYVKTLTDGGNETIKLNMKPQTLLVDFDPNRMFVMQEMKSKIYNANVDTGGNSALKDRIEKELNISPIVTLNANKLVQVNAVDIMNVVRDYQKDKGINEEAMDTAVDINILNDPTIRKIMERENEIDARAGLSTQAYEEDDETGQDLDVPANSENGNENMFDAALANPNMSEKAKRQLINSLKKKIQSYYARILLFAYLTKNKVLSLEEIINIIDIGENKRIAKNLGLSKKVLILLKNKTNKFILSDLDYKIQNLNELSHTTEISPEERANIAMSKFGKFGDAVVVTPSQICDEMVAHLTDDFLKDMAKRNGRILDIAGTEGEYAVALFKKLSALKINKEKIANIIYTIPKSPISYELTRKLYEMLGLNVKNIAEKFVATDLLTIKNTKKQIDYEKIKRLLTQNKPFNTIELEDNVSQGGEMIKFDAVVGNPPYQVSKGKKNFDIWQYFVKSATDLADLAALIHPGRWVVPKKNMQKINEMITGQGLVSFNYYPDATKLFNKVSIDGGVTITYFKNGYSGNIEYYNKGKYYGIYNSSSIFISNEFEDEIFKILNPDHFGGQTMLMRMLGNTGSLAGQEFGYQKSIHIKYLRTSPKGMKNPIKIWANNSYGKGTRFGWFYIDAKYLSKPPAKLFSSRKVMIDKKGHAISSGKNNIFNNNPQIVEKNSTASGDVLFFFPERDDDYHLNLIKSYFMTKTIRFLMSIKQKDLYVRGFEIVPDYTYFIHDLNGELFTDKFFYNHFNFSKELQQHIEAAVSEKK